MASFEPSVIEVQLYCEDYFINSEIIKEKLSNLKLKDIQEINAEDTSGKLDFSTALEYFDEEAVQSIIGEKLRGIPKESYKICFVSSEAEFIKLKDFKGIVICLEGSYVDGIRTNNIIVKDKEQVLNIIYSLYYSLNSYHIFPYDLHMIIGGEFNILVQKTDLLTSDQTDVIIWHYRNVNSAGHSKAVFINTKDESIRQLKGLDLYNKVLGKIDRSCLGDMDIDSVIAMNYII